MTASETIAAALRDEGCLGRSQADEPVFVLCARDRYAASKVREWAATVAGRHGKSAKTEEAFDCADQMDAWRVAQAAGRFPGYQ